MQNALVVALRARRVDILTAADFEMIGRADEDHLRCAASDGRVLYSFNIKDFCLLAGSDSGRLACVPGARGPGQSSAPFTRVLPFDEDHLQRVRVQFLVECVSPHNQRVSPLAM